MKKAIGIIFILLSIIFGLSTFFCYAIPEANEIILPPLINIPLTIVYFIGGIGLISLKRWARIFTIGLLSVFAIFSAFYAYLFLSFTVLKLFTLQPGTKIFIYPPPNNYKDVMSFITIDITRDIILPSIFVLFVVLSFVSMFYFIRHKE